MKVLSVNVGLPREVSYRGMQVSTGIFKEPVSGSIPVRKLNLDGDRQADLSVHGGEEKAVYAYPIEHYQYWRQELGQDLPLGMFGENLTTEGLREDQLSIGDELLVGSALLRVVQPRMPCYKLAMRFDRDDMIKRFLASRKSGFYFSVINEGAVSADATIEVASRDQHSVTVSDITQLYVERGPSSLLERAVAVPALPESWRQWLLQRSHGHSA
ncbi:MAG: MOSC domain-containing protein [Acidobacteriales bacterium]|nr:MOSC domain-containing protein [Terriglobales bacterium]